MERRIYIFQRHHNLIYWYHFVLTKLGNFFKTIGSNKYPNILLFLLMFVHERPRSCCTRPMIKFSTGFTLYTSSKMFAMHTFLCDAVEYSLVYIYVSIIFFWPWWCIRGSTFFSYTSLTSYSFRPKGTFFMYIKMS